MERNFKHLEAWRSGMSLVGLVFDLTAKLQREGGGEEAGDALRLAALEVAQRIAAGAAAGRPGEWLQCLALARAALDRLEEEASGIRAFPAHRLAGPAVRVRRELLALQGAAVAALLGPDHGTANSVEAAFGEAA